jgi:cytidylate kinase
MEQPFFHRICITGDPGSGKSTFAREVAHETGYRLITTGNMFRELAAQHGVSVTELNLLAETKEEIDRRVDDYLRTLNNVPEHLILDSRMAWHFLHGALKIRLSVAPEVAVARIFNDRDTQWREKFPDLETAMEEVRRRKESEIQRYSALYGVDISCNSNFDLVIDTSHKTPAEIMEEFRRSFAAYCDSPRASAQR